MPSVPFTRGEDTPGIEAGSKLTSKSFRLDAKIRI
jgi:hypothetical protein